MLVLHTSPALNSLKNIVNITAIVAMSNYNQSEKSVHLSKWKFSIPRIEKFKKDHWCQSFRLSCK